MTDNYEVRDVIDKETLSTVKSVGDTYKYGFSTDIETEYAPSVSYTHLTLPTKRSV